DAPAARRVAERLIERLREVGESLAVLGDSDAWRGLPGVRFRSLREDGRDLEPEEIRRRAAELQDASRILFDLHAGMAPDRAARLLEDADRALSFLPAASPAA